MAALYYELGIARSNAESIKAIIKNCLDKPLTLSNLFESLNRIEDCCNSIVQRIDNAQSN
jgi:hypothetical protein